MKQKESKAWLFKMENKYQITPMHEVTKAPLVGELP